MIIPDYCRHWGIAECTMNMKSHWARREIPPRSCRLDKGTPPWVSILTWLVTRRGLSSFFGSTLLTAIIENGTKKKKRGLTQCRVDTLWTHKKTKKKREKKKGGVPPGEESAYERLPIDFRMPFASREKPSDSQRKREKYYFWFAFLLLTRLYTTSHCGCELLFFCIFFLSKGICISNKMAVDGQLKGICTCE